MNPEEYVRMEAAERRHWFYRGKRTVVRHWLERFVTFAPETKLLDVGCGTGLFVEEMAKSCSATGIDDHDEALALARSRGAGTFVKLTGPVLPFDDGSFDAVTALDVLEHIEDHLAALRQMARVAKPGATLVVTVPAFMLLWSEWDVVLHHFRRYRKHEVAALATAAGLEVVECRYINSAVFPAVVAFRKLREWLPFLKGGTRAEDRIPAPWLNSLLEALFVRPACWGWFRPPFGVSVLAVLRKPK
jgi:2-polyprenyl-3-methyl-5-hydroxy-6-metoxy-1,4-benzoquinol methylase